MAISPAEITRIENAFTPKLRAAGPLPPGKTIQLTTNEGQMAINDADFLELFAEACTESRRRQATWCIDAVLLGLKKPQLPPKYKAWVIELMKELERVNDSNVTSLPLPSYKGIFKIEELSEWDIMSRFACMDAARFSDCCSDDRDFFYKEQIINRAYLAREAYPRRYSDYLTSEQKAPGDNSTFTRLNEYLDCAKAVNIYLKKAEAGICTTFAWAAAFPLIERMKKESQARTASLLKRIEVVAFTNHIFVIVNRAGAKLATNEKIPSNATWGDGVYQVDVWLASLGHPTIYKGVQGVNVVFLEGLKSLFDSRNFIATA